MVQEVIEEGVRAEVGRRLNMRMSETDSVFLEPLGYIGMEIRGKTAYDFPGLGSPKVVAAIKQLPAVRMGGVIDVLRPDYLVLRPREIEEFHEHFPHLAPQYREVERVKARSDIEWRRWRYGVYPTDTEFAILKFSRTSPTR